MREIKFSGKRIDNGQWVCGELLSSNLIRNHGKGILLKSMNMSGEGVFTCDVFIVDPKTIMRRGGVMEETSYIYDEEDCFWECQKCGLAWILNDGGPEQNEMYYCPKCGREITRSSREGDGDQQ